ncbi:VaFE repeat-containing surface-anchored protein [Rathayibacter sp. YIM 133350]|uniref:VaFE repeat-containing surface-anchored protein n=1 Tax=Rathayibacter sp. YIM 133350 TaxID=3131992 RepID=UPI00307EE4EA
MTSQCALAATGSTGGVLLMIAAVVLAIGAGLVILGRGRSHANTVAVGAVLLVLLGTAQFAAAPSASAAEPCAQSATPDAPPAPAPTPTPTPTPPPATPTISTIATDAADGDKTLPAVGGTIIDTVQYAGLVVGRLYRLDGVLLNAATGVSVGITATTSFTPTVADGVTTVEFTVGPGFAGLDLVVSEILYDGDTVIAREDAPDDVEQTIHVALPPPPLPTVTTSAVDAADGDRTLPTGGGTITDTIAFTGLTAGRSYTLVGVLMDKATGSSTGITSTRVFTAAAPAGTTTNTFIVPAGYDGKDLVVFETILDGATVVAQHTDFNDANQTIHFNTTPPPAVISTSAVDQADGDRVLSYNGGMITDTVTFSNLTPGATYELAGELMDQSTGGGTGIVATRTFTPVAPAGTITIDFTVPASLAGETLVVFQKVRLNGVEVATEMNLNDPLQTITVENPPIG